MLTLVNDRYTLVIFTARKRSLGQGNVFTPVCDSLHRGVCVSQHAMGRGVCFWCTPPLATPLDTLPSQEETPSWIHPAWADIHPGQTPPPGHAPPGHTPWADTPRQTPPGQTRPLKMTTEVGGTHPNGMHSCSLIDLRHMIECYSILDHFW